MELLEQVRDHEERISAAEVVLSQIEDHCKTMKEVKDVLVGDLQNKGALHEFKDSVVAFNNHVKESEEQEKILFKGNGSVAIVPLVRQHQNTIVAMQDEISTIKQAVERRRKPREEGKKFSIASLVNDLDWFRWVILIMIASNYLDIRPVELLKMIIALLGK